MNAEQTLLSNLLANGSVITILVLSWFLAAYWLFQALQKTYSKLLENSQRTFQQMLEASNKTNTELSKQLNTYIDADQKTKAMIIEILTKLDLRIDMFLKILNKG